MCRKAKVDENSICRQPDGKFAVQVCCTTLCQGARLTKDHATPAQFHCRGTDGTFVPAGCCNKEASGIPLSEMANDDTSSSSSGSTLKKGDVCGHSGAGANGKDAITGKCPSNLECSGAGNNDDTMTCQ
jgi:hypothetical protein